MSAAQKAKYLATLRGNPEVLAALAATEGRRKQAAANYRALPSPEPRRRHAA